MEVIRRQNSKKAHNPARGAHTCRSHGKPHRSGALVTGSVVHVTPAAVALAGGAFVKLGLGVVASGYMSWTPGLIYSTEFLLIIQ